MGKHEVGTPKYIANKIKAKGLQKLRWYCQMCQKQCRDENGFKCHTMSESHHRQLLLFADNASRYMDQFSREFELGYMSILKRQFGTKRVPANRVYQNYIADRSHVHMNATIWLSLTGFVKYLGRTGKAVVDETEKGWFLTYIDRDPDTIAAQERKAKKEKMDKDDDERTMDFIRHQVEQGSVKTQHDDSMDFKRPFERPEDHKPVVLQLSLKPKITPSTFSVSGPAVNSLETNLGETSTSNGETSISFVCSQSEKIQEQEATEKSRRSVKKERNIVRGGWLVKDLVVKVMTKALGNKYHKAKGIVRRTEDSGFVAEVKLKSPEAVKDHVVKVDQEHLETVIPAIGKPVMILWGKHKHTRALVRNILVKEFSVKVDLQGEKPVKTILLPYEQICKYTS